MRGSDDTSSRGFPGRGRTLNEWLIPSLPLSLTTQNTCIPMGLQAARPPLLFGASRKSVSPPLLFVDKVYSVAPRCSCLRVASAFGISIWYFYCFGIWCELHEINLPFWNLNVATNIRSSCLRICVAYSNLANKCGWMFVVVSVDDSMRWDFYPSIRLWTILPLAVGVWGRSSIFSFTNKSRLACRCHLIKVGGSGVHLVRVLAVALTRQRKRDALLEKLLPKSRLIFRWNGHLAFG